MKQTLKLLGAVILFIITGCQFNKLPPGDVAAWEKNGVTDFTEVGKALLECGLPSLIDADTENRNLSYNANATIDACMLQAGFRYKYDVGGDGVETIKPKTFRFVVLALSFHSAVSRSA
ncbi:hypothetical protein PRJBM_00680 [Bartonella henselae]|uniref:Uncharacterized protein n=2 Tax=Bartonella henselae TaxID=38323 RepID=X5M445_BARHN|nr:hypothetical protein Q655_01631 [Bartonella henselae JK 51]ETS10889.1 hypothetical protein Q654_00037 [Bartonella henselae JK 50]CDO40065.1 hypothetical protein PRJBM_00680 [Bartonella henselae]CDO46671.1 hypothetical protein BM1374165_00656 [Bartonella henselae]CUH90639.1 hypothetical protein BM1374164_00680 [Bartonella henselae]